MRRALLAAASLVAMVGAMAPSPGSAAPIVFTHTGTGSGSIDGDPFTDAAFTITATGDTANRESFGSGFFIDHDTASISIAGVGDFVFVTGTRTFVNNLSDTVGFSREGLGGTDLYNGPTDSAFATWDMLSSIGPITGTTSLLQWSFDPVIITDGGQLLFDSATTSGSFQAAVVPEPSTFALAGIGGLGLFGVVRRRRRA